VEARLGLEQATNQSSKKNIGAKGDKRMEIMIIKVSVFIPHSAFRIPHSSSLAYSGQVRIPH